MARPWFFLVVCAPGREGVGGHGVHRLTVHPQVDVQGLRLAGKSSGWNSAWRHGSDTAQYELAPKGSDVTKQA